MKRLLLLFVLLLMLASTQMHAQSIDRHPISTASIEFIDGRSEILFEEGVYENFTVQVRDLTGKMIYALQNDRSLSVCNSVELPVENLKKGIYMVLITGDSGKTKTLKLQRN